MLQVDFSKVICPACQRTILHYLGGMDSTYRSRCQKCGKTILIYSAGKTAVVTEPMVEINIGIKF